MSFQQGLSGLNGAAKALDVIGNNIANSSTVGFKGSTTQFADVYASSLSGAGGVTAGIGVKVAAISQQFSQGNVESSNNPLDIAINGAGFFRTETAGMVQYSRNGQFSLDKNGFMINAQGAKLTGYGLNANGQLAAGAPVPLKIDTTDLQPVSTKEVGMQLNLDSRSLRPVNTPFDANDPTTYNKQTPISVYDTLGNPHVLSTYYVKGDGGTWNVYAANDGVEITGTGTAVGTLVFDTNGALDKEASSAGGKLLLTLPISPDTGAELELPVEIDYDGTTQYGTATSEKKLLQDGFSPGSLQRFSAGADGTILAQYSNGQTRPLGQIVLANFTNPNGLESLGNNAWAESANSGVPLVGAPESGSFGSLQSSAVESSSVDLTAELVNMITAQRAYQANAQTIKTQDSVLQTLVNLR